MNLGVANASNSWKFNVCCLHDNKLFLNCYLVVFSWCFSTNYIMRNKVYTILQTFIEIYVTVFFPILSFTLDIIFDHIWITAFYHWCISCLTLKYLHYKCNWCKYILENEYYIVMVIVVCTLNLLEDWCLSRDFHFSFTSSHVSWHISQSQLCSWTSARLRALISSKGFSVRIACLETDKSS